MKNTIKFLGIIAFVAVIGFGVVACSSGGGGDGGGGGGNGGTLKITNENTEAITKVKVENSDGVLGEYDVNITTGNTWTQSISFSETTASLFVTVSFGSNTKNKNFTLSKGGTQALKLDSNGQLDTP